jgi:hypothetical protein
MSTNISDDAELSRLLSNGGGSNKTDQEFQKNIMARVVRQVGFMKLAFLAVALALAFLKIFSVFSKPRRT